MGLELRTAWGEFVGPEATAAENGLMLSSGLAGLAVAPFLTAAARALPLGEALLLRILAGDLWGGVVANNTRACARWYERPGQTDADHLRFAAAHLHPVLVAGLDRRAPGARRALGGQPLRLPDAGHGAGPARRRSAPAVCGPGADLGPESPPPGAR